MTLDRRTFVAAGAASVLGFRYLRLQDPPKATWFDEGLKRIKETGLPGIVVMFPNATYMHDYGEGRKYLTGHPDYLKLTDDFGARLKSDNRTVAELFSGAVWICLREDDAKEKLDKPARLTRIDGDGNIVERVDAKLSDFESDEAFAKAAQNIVEKDLKERVERAWKGVKNAEALKKALKDLGNDDPDARDAATKSIDGMLPAALTIVIQAGREATDPEVSGRCSSIVRAFWTRKDGLQLPYGAEWVTELGGCGGDARLNDENIPLPACGMAVMPEEPKKLLKVLALKKKTP